MGQIHFSAVFTLGIIILCLQACRPNPEQKPMTEATGISERPNIIMVVVDDMRWDEFSAMGHPYLNTPNIDRLAKEGALFENAFQAVPLCSPNRASILTGQYPTRHGIVDNVARDRASHHLNLFAPYLQKAGYETAHVGKWHMGNDPTPRPGYDYWACLPGQGRCIDPILYEEGKLDTIPGYVTDVLHEKALNFIVEDRTKPFFLYIGHKAIHPDSRQLNNGAIDLTARSHFIPAPRHRGIYKEAVFTRRANALSSYAGIDSTTVIGEALRRKNSSEIRAEFGGEILDDFTDEQTIRDRSEMLLAIDEGLGQMMDKLDSLGILDNTFILFTSDNGYFYGEHGLSLERRLPYEESVRNPLLIRYPKLVKAGTRISQLISSVDYAPTALELAGIEIPDHIQGRSVLPLFSANEKDWRDGVLIEYFSFENPFPWLIDTDYKALRTDRYKYIHWYKHEGKDELYDLREDPFEMKNLYQDPNMQKLVQEMRRRLAEENARIIGL